MGLLDIFKAKDSKTEKEDPAQIKGLVHSPLSEKPAPFKVDEDLKDVQGGELAKKELESKVPLPPPLPGGSEQKPSDIPIPPSPMDEKIPEPPVPEIEQVKTEPLKENTEDTPETISETPKDMETPDKTPEPEEKPSIPEPPKMESEIKLDSGELPELPELPKIDENEELKPIEFKPEEKPQELEIDEQLPPIDDTKETMPEHEEVISEEIKPTEPETVEENEKLTELPDKIPPIETFEPDLRDKSSLGSIELEDIKESRSLELDTEKKAPIFVSAEEFDNIGMNIEAMNWSIKESEKIFSNMKDLKENKDAKLEEWHKMLEEIQRKLVYLDNKLFNVL